MTSDWSGLSLFFCSANAVVSAKCFIHAAIEDGLKIGGGHGPTNHWAYGRRGNKTMEGVVVYG